MDDASRKVKILDPNTTQENATLNHLHNKRSLSFATPNDLYHSEYDGRYYIVLSRLTGYALIEAWPNMEEGMKQYYVSRVENICKKLAVLKADGSSAINHITQSWTIIIDGNKKCIYIETKSWPNWDLPVSNRCRIGLNIFMYNSLQKEQFGWLPRLLPRNSNSYSFSKLYWSLSAQRTWYNNFIIVLWLSLYTNNLFIIRPKNQWNSVILSRSVAEISFRIISQRCQDL